MLCDCPDPKEVSDFHFLQLRTLRLLQEKQHVPEKSVNLVTCASKYDLLFVGVEGGFKVLKLEDILTLDEDRDNRSIVESYPSIFVPCDTPSFLSVNATQTVLVVCAKSATGAVLLFYSLSSFDSPWQPFCSKPISSSGCELQSFVWNPALEGLYAFCLTDGSLHIHEITGSTVKATSSLNAEARAVCWSPKGKQLVVGKQNGTFCQYKPNLAVVSTVMPPAFEDGPLFVTSIYWISTSIFAVVYVANNVPNLFIVSTPKGGTITYTNFNDVCLGNNSASEQKYFMFFEPSWGLLLCSSFDSIEIAVLGSLPSWVQWDLKEDGKALLPGKDGALNAVGMTVMYSAQKQIIISESVTYPPMPILFFLTNNGLLVSFHMVNENSNAPILVSAPVPTELKICSGNDKGSRTEELVNRNSFILSSQPVMSSTPVTTMNVAASQIPAPVNAPQSSALGMKAKSAFTLSSGLENMHNLTGNQMVVTNLNKSGAVPTNSSLESEKNSQLQTSPATFTCEKENEAQSNAENSYIRAIISEIQSFEKEFQELKQLQNSLPAISVDDDMSSLKVFALNLENFQKDITETMQSLSSDIYTLKNVLLESFVLFEEASSRERRRNDHSYITMLKERALDPITARQMQKRNQLFQYLSTQLQELNNKLDQDWILHMSNKKKLSNFHISSTEAIYKTIVNNQKSIHNFKKNLDRLLKEAEEKKLRNITNNGSSIRHHKRLPREDLSKLADEFLQIKITQQDETETLTKKLSSESQNFLINFLKKSSVMTVRPTAVYSPSQSRLLSDTVLTDDTSRLDQVQDISPKTVLTSSTKEMNEKLTFVCETQNAAMMPKPIKENTPVKPYFPIYEPITPPEITTTVPESADKVFTCLLKENKAEAFSQLSSISADRNLDKGICSSLLYSEKSNNNLPQFSFTPEMKSRSFNQAVSEPFSSSTNVFPSTFSFTASIQNNSEPNISKPVTFSNSPTSLPTSGFQFGQKKDSYQSVSSTVVSSSAASTLKPNLDTNVIPESLQQFQQDKFHGQHPNATFVMPANNNTNSILPIAKNSLMSASLVTTTEEKLSSAVQNNGDVSVTQPIKNRDGFFFEPNKSEQAIKDNNTSSSDFQSVESLSFTLNSVDKIISPITQSPSCEQQKQLHTDFQKSTTSLISSNIPSNVADIDPGLKTDNLIGTNNSKVNTSDVRELKQAVSLSDASSEHEKPPVLTPVIESVRSTAPSLTTTIVPSVTITETVTSLSNSKPLSPPQTTLLPQNIPSSPPVLFGQTIPTSLDSSKSDVPTMPVQILEQSQSETPSFFSSVKTEAPTSNETSTNQTSLGQQPPSTTVAHITSFDQSASAPVTQTTALNQPSSTTVTQPNLFGDPSTTTVTQTTLFGQPASASVTRAPFFGQPTSTSNFSSTAGGFFSQTPTFGASDAISTATPTGSNFNSQSSTFSFGKPPFGQATGSFGLAKSLFGQDTTSFTQSATPSSFSFNQNSSSGFGQGSFFSGLGGKPSEENASKNVFGIGSSIKPSDTSNLFKNSSVKSFGSTNGNSFSGAGNFSSGGGSVAQSGFGSFQQTSAQQPGGFGAAPAFGGNPAFGSSPSFGGSPAFGSGNCLSPVFGQQQVSSSFSNFANASSPTFGSLASQNTGFSSPGFGTPTFGSTPAFGTSSFGGQSPGFSSPGNSPNNSSAFTQWRN